MSSRGRITDVPRHDSAAKTTSEMAAVLAETAVDDLIAGTATPDPGVDRRTTPSSGGALAEGARHRA